MKSAILIRTGSLPAQPHIVGSPRGSSSGTESGAGVSFLRRSRSARSALHLDVMKERKEMCPKSIRRAISDTDLVGSNQLSRIASRWSPPARVVEEEEEDLGGKACDLGASDLVGGISVVVREEEVEYSGGGMGKGRKIGGGNGGGGREGGGGNHDRGMGEYYQEMLRSDPGNPLLLRNYGRFLQEVEGDVKGAEEYYGRALLASPGDGDVLSLYGKLVWEVHGDEERAGSYFERAVEASPNDCYVLGSYANFLWDTEEDGDEEEERRVASLSSSSPFVEAC